MSKEKKHGQGRHKDAELHVRGRSEYVDDVTPPAGMLTAVPFGSPLAHGTIRGINLDAARSAPGVVCVLTRADLPAEKMIGAIIPDEPLLADETVCFQGQVIALVVAESWAQAVHARSLIEIDIDPLPVITEPRQAFAAGELMFPSRTFEIGNIDKAWAACAHIVEGRCEIGGQEHVPLETNRARALPRENGEITVWSSTQSPYSAQKAVAKVLGIPEHKVEVDVKRLGGGFGGKEDQATHWACHVAVAARRTGRAVELVLSREEDIRMTGKRHPYACDFKLGLDADGKILAYKAELYQNSGAFADLSMPVLERSLLHATNAYNIPNARVMAVCCRTHLAPNTAFRGFGGPQAMFVMESAIAKAADQMGLRRDAIQEVNLLRTGDRFYYGQELEACRMRVTWDEAVEHFELADIRSRAEDFNASNRQFKKGVSVMPVCFGISFTKTFLNQGSALVHIYTDGSIGVTTGGIEMGQGMSSNMIAVAARVFGISPDRIKVEATNTTRVANMSPSAASATSDLNGHAVRLACEEILPGLLETASEMLKVPVAQISIEAERVLVDSSPSELEWQALVLNTYFARRRLSASGFYATPDIGWDGEKGWGKPFAYHVYGTCITEVTVDCLRGIYTVDACKVVHDVGRSINELVDRGQIEGGLVQGLGWMTMGIWCSMTKAATPAARSPPTNSPTFISPPTTSE